jgi:nucleoside-diphosphate-sugar epimerase
LVFKDHKIDAVIHTATSYGRDDTALNTLKANEGFALELLETAANANVSVFLNTDTFFNVEKISYNYMVYYTTSKKNFVNWGLAFALEKKIKFINIKLHHLYGFGDNPNKFVESIIRKILNNEPKMDLTSGLQKRDFIYINDAVSAYYYLLENINNYLEYFIEVSLGSGKPTTIKALVSQIKQIAKNETTKLNFGVIPDRANEFKESVADLSFLNNLGFTPKYDIVSGLSDYIKQFNFQ